MTASAQIKIGPHIGDFIREKGERLLELLGESPQDGARWQLHAQGAWVAVKVKESELFERIVAVQIRDPRMRAETFKAAAEARVRGIGRYLEATNTGRVVQSFTRDLSVTAILMRRIGADPLGGEVLLPAPELFPTVLKGFLKAVRLYLDSTGDRALRFVSAVRLYPVPRQKGPDESVLALDVTNALVGLRQDPGGIEPIALVRGVIGELAEQYVDLGESVRAPASASRPVALAKATAEGLQIKALVSQLDDLCAQIEVNHPDLATVADWVDELSISRFLWVKPVLITLGVAVALLLMAWWLW